MEDDTIIEMFFNRSESAITELDRQYGKLCRYIAMNILNDQEDAEEVVNDTFLKVWQMIPPRRPLRLMAYVAKISRNTAIDRLKYKRRQKRGDECNILLSEFDECVPSVDDVAAQHDMEEIAELINCFLRMCDRQTQALFTRRYFMSDSIEQLALDFSMSKAQVSDTLYQTRKKLKHYLEREGVAI